jgi:hypothetical protein
MNGRSFLLNTLASNEVLDILHLTTTVAIGLAAAVFPL